MRFSRVVFAAAAVVLLSVVPVVSHAMTGGVSDAVPASKLSEFEAAANAAVLDLNEQGVSGSDAYTLVRVVKVKTQIVAGTIIHVTYEAEKRVEGGGAPHTELCVGRVWEKIDGTFEVTRNACVLAVRSGSANFDSALFETQNKYGGYQKMSVDAQGARSAAVEFLRERLGDANACDDGVQVETNNVEAKKKKMFILCDARYQIVAGTKYRIAIAEDDQTPATCGLTGTVFRGLDDAYQVLESGGG